MADVKRSWEEAASKLSGLGLKLKLHFEEERTEPSDGDDAESAVVKLRDAMDDAFEALGNATKDEAVKSDVKEAAALLRVALSETFSEAGESFRKAVDKLDR